MLDRAEKATPFFFVEQAATFLGWFFNFSLQAGGLIAPAWSLAHLSSRLVWWHQLGIEAEGRKMKYL
ncbi:hypothetical protein OH492_20365 [Vibrio chagasii]|nr:hypothetical protein [Vibrio chagasii]